MILSTLLLAICCGALTIAIHQQRSTKINQDEQLDLVSLGRPYIYIYYRIREDWRSSSARIGGFVLRQGIETHVSPSAQTE